jgi:hypothetical protein
MSSMPATKVCHLSSVHDAFDARIFHKECTTLAAAGYDVVYICPHAADQTLNGVRIRCVPIPLRGRGERMTTTAFQLASAAAEEAASLYHFHDPELFPVAFFLAARGHAVVYDDHEDLPLAMGIKTYLPRWARVILAPLARIGEPVLARICAAVVVPAEYMKTRFLRAGVRRVVAIHNYPITSHFHSRSPVERASRELNIIYAGSLSSFRGIDTNVKAMSLLPERVRARLVLCGGWDPPELLEELRADPGFARTEYKGVVAHTDLAARIEQADVGIATLQPTKAYMRALPTKLFEYLALGLPVVVSDFPAWRKLVEANHCGICVDPSDAASIARAITYLHDHPEERRRMGENGRAVSAAYTWESEGRRLVALYEEILAAR